MAQIVPRIDRRQGVLELSFPGLEAVQVELVVPEDRRRERVAEDICLGRIYSIVFTFQTGTINLMYRPSFFTTVLYS